MQSTNIDTLTADEKQFINNLSLAKKVSALHYLASEELGLVTVAQYHQITGDPVRTIYHYVSENRLMNTEILNQKAIIMNDHI